MEIGEGTLIFGHFKLFNETICDEDRQPHLSYVDDEEDMLDISKLFLELEEDIRVETETSAKEAEMLLESKQFDAVISDYQMPEMSGIDFLKHLRAKGNDVPFILFTGKGREEVVIEAINSGADSYVQKGGEARSQFMDLGHKIEGNWWPRDRPSDP